jgi:hypothetical protein
MGPGQPPPDHAPKGLSPHMGGLRQLLAPTLQDAPPEYFTTPRGLSCGWAGGAWPGRKQRLGGGGGGDGARGLHGVAFSCF